MHITSGIPNQTSHTQEKTFAHGWFRWAGATKCLRVDPHREQISKEVFEKAVQLAKITFWEEKKTRLELWEEHLKDPIIALDKAFKCSENSY